MRSNYDDSGAARDVEIEFIKAIIEASIKAGIATADCNDNYGKDIAFDDIAFIVKRFGLSLNNMPHTKLVVESKLALPENYRFAVREMAAHYFGYAMEQA